MSSQRSGNGLQRFSNSNLSGGLSRGAPEQKPNLVPHKGLVSLGGVPKRTRGVGSAVTGKLAVPKPVNLPSLRKENAGNDPTTQIVPSKSGVGWQKPEPEQAIETERAASLVASSNWASPQVQQQLAGPPEPGPVPANPSRARGLNPAEYPSLSAAAYAAQQQQQQAAKQPGFASGSAQASGNWDEDERRGPTPPLAKPGQEADWDRPRHEDDPHSVPGLPDRRDDLRRARPGWDDRYAHERGPEEGYGRPIGRDPGDHPEREYGRGHYPEPNEHDHHRPRPEDDRRYAARGYGDGPSRGSHADEDRWGRGPLPSRYDRGPPPPYERGYDRGSPRLLARDDFDRGMPPHRPQPGQYEERGPSADRHFDRILKRPPPPPPGHAYGHHGEDLFPPPPPRGAKGPGAAYPEDRRGAEADPEREAFNAELDKLASEMEKERQRKRTEPSPESHSTEGPPLTEDAASAKHSSEEAAVSAEMLGALAQAKAAAPGSAEEQAALAQVKAARTRVNYKPLNDEVGEEHRRRAAQKLKELEAKLQADAEAKRRLAEEAAAKQAAQEEAARQAAEEAAAAEAAERSTEHSSPDVRDPLPITAETVGNIAAELSSEGRGHTHAPSSSSAVGSSLDVEVNSSVGPALSDHETAGRAPPRARERPGSSVPAAALPEQAGGQQQVPNAWKRPLLGEAQQQQHANHWQAREPTPAEAALQAQQPPLGAQQQPPLGTAQQGGSPLFAGGMGFGPTLLQNGSRGTGVLLTNPQPAPPIQRQRQGHQLPSGWLPPPPLAPENPDSREGAPSEAADAAGRGSKAARGKQRRGRNTRGGAGGEAQDQSPPQAQQQPVSEPDGRGVAGRGRGSRGRGGRVLRQRDGGKDEVEHVPEAGAEDAASGQPADSAQSTATVEGIFGAESEWEAPGAAEEGSNRPSDAAAGAPSKRQQRRQQQREESAKRSRNRGPGTGRGQGPRGRGGDAPQDAVAAPPGLAPAASAPGGPISRALQGPPGLGLAPPSNAPLQDWAGRQDAWQPQPHPTSSGLQLQQQGPARSAGMGVVQLDQPISMPFKDSRGPQVERPISVGSAVSRPKSANAVERPRADVLPNGMVALPEDLSLDAPVSSQLPPQSTGPLQSPSQMAPFGFGQGQGMFPGGLFPGGPNSNGNMWQQPPPPPRGPGGRLPMQGNLESSMGSFYGPSTASNPTGAPFSSGPFPGSTQPPGAGSAPPLVLPQFGSFGPGFGGLQFGNLGGAFGQSPFVPTGRQPDWSTGPIASSPVPSTQGGQGFPASQPGSSGDAILPGPPGLAFKGKGPPGPPPGLQGSSRGGQGQGQQRLGSSSAGGGGPHGQQQGLGGLSGAPAQHVSVADSKGHAAAAVLPDDVSDAPPGQGHDSGQSGNLSKNQQRRADRRGRGGGRGSGSDRGRGFRGRGQRQGNANTEARSDGPPPGRSESQSRQQRQSQNGPGPRQQGQVAANAPASLPEGAPGDAAAARQSGGRGRGKPRGSRGRGRGSNSNGGSDQQRGRAPASQPPGPLASATT